MLTVIHRPASIILSFRFFDLARLRALPLSGVKRAPPERPTQLIEDVLIHNDVFKLFGETKMSRGRFSEVQCDLKIFGIFSVWQAAVVRMRPVMMTCVAACVGLLPAAVSTGIGSQVQKPLALVVVGGILLAPNLILVVVPVLISLFSRRQPNPEARGRAEHRAAA